jgi:hypothetical protein
VILQRKITKNRCEFVKYYSCKIKYY